MVLLRVGDISRSFNRCDFACPCGCGFDTVDVELVKVLQKAWDYFDNPMIIIAGTFCMRYSEKIEGTMFSQHTKAKAADIRIRNISLDNLYCYLDTKYPHCYGIGIYTVKNFIHFDVRHIRARWKVIV